RLRGPNLAAVDGIPGPAELPAELSYEALQRAALGVAAALQRRPELRASAPAAPGVLGSALRRGNDFYALFLASSYCYCPLVALSDDLQDKAHERQRNEQILLELQPRLLVVHDVTDPLPLAVPLVCFRDLLSMETFHPASAPDAEATLCFQYTGGTTGASRCCKASHGMALWEIAKYREVVHLDPAHRVLQQHSVYWAASMFGEIDIALAFGAALVFVVATGLEDLKEQINRHQASCAGLVPSLLEALQPAQVPSLRVVFTWGEALDTKVAVHWASAPELQLVDLLIATEYWLSLYANWTTWSARTSRTGERPGFRAVSGVRLRLGAEDGESGELLLSGPMVSPGYLDPKATAENFLEERGSRWYRSRDVLQRRGEEYFHCGRADDLAKVGGLWVDTRQVTESLREVPGVTEACIHSKAAFVCLENSEAVPLLRRRLPPDHGLFVVRGPLPRAPTGKVDRRAVSILAGVQHATPGCRLLGADQAEVLHQLKHLRLLRSWLSPLCLLVLGPLWHLAASEKDLTSCIWSCAELVLRTVLLSYLFLSLLYHDGLLRLLGRYVPFGHVMAVVLWAGLVPLWLLAASAVDGAVHAAGRRRLSSWPMVFLVGFPRWARDSGNWWYQSSGRNVLDWYKRSLKADYHELQKKLPSCLKRKRVCHHCKKPTMDGKVDPKDSKWYCDACWKYYDNHWACQDCKLWVVRGRRIAGKWLCLKCAEKAAANPPVPPVPPVPLAVPLLEAEAEPPIKRQRVDESWVQHYQPPSQEVRSAAAPAHAADAAAGPGNSTPRAQRTMALPCLASPDEPMVASGGSADVEKCDVWRFVEETLDWRFDSEDEPLGIDSLRWTKLASALQRRGRLLPPRGQVRTLGELLRGIQTLPEILHTHEDVGQEWPAWGMMWSSVCTWKMLCQRPVSDAELRAAVEKLMWRHVALRTRPADRMPIFREVQSCLSVLQLWRLLWLSRPGSAAAALRPVLDLATWAMKAAWPRVKTEAPQVGKVIIQLGTADSKEAAENNIKHCKEPFEPPFQLLVARFQSEEAAGLVLQMRVTHMFSDGFCIVPLLSDLGSIIAQEALPPLPSAFAALLPRIHRTVEGDHRLADAVTPAHLDKSSYTANVRAEMLAMTPPQVGFLKHTARKLAVADDILMLTAVAVSMAKLHGQASQTIQVIVPQRDEPMESDMVGLFTDYRRLDVPAQGLSYVGAALAVHHLVKERLWRAPPAVKQGTCPFVNFMWTDFEERHGFVPLVVPKGKDVSTMSPMQVVVVQPDRESWRILCTFNADLYSAADAERYYGFLEEALRCLLEEPLALVM
ncbi:unnamed protein product, partial [Effrenium voratum]